MAVLQGPSSIKCVKSLFLIQRSKSLTLSKPRSFFVNLDHKKGPKYFKERFPYLIVLKREAQYIFRLSSQIWLVPWGGGEKLFITINCKLKKKSVKKIATSMALTLRESRSCQVFHLCNFLFGFVFTA